VIYLHPQGVYTPVKLAHTPCANVTPNGQGCVAASYVSLLLILRVIGAYCIHGKMHHLAFCGSQICKKSKFSGALPQTPLGQLTALPRPPSWWGGGLLPLPRNPNPALCPTGLARVRPLSHVHTLPGENFWIKA